MKSTQSGLAANLPPLLCIALSLLLFAGCALHRPPAYATGPGADMRSARVGGAALVERGFAGTLGSAGASEDDSLATTSSRSERRQFHVDFGLRVSYTLLRETKQDLDRWLDTPLKTDVLGLWDSPQTPLDRRSDLGLTTLYVGVGSETDDWLIWTVYAGGGAGGDHEHQRIANLDMVTDFDYLHVYTGVLFEMYPWGKPAEVAEPGLINRIKASRPYILAGVEVGFLDAEGGGHLSAASVRLNEHHQTVRDLLVSNLFGLGWGIPLSDRWAFNVSTHYAFHYYRPDEYNSWVVTSALRYRF